MTYAQNPSGIDCGTPHARIVGTHEHLALHAPPVRTAYESVRAVCPHLPPSALAHCSGTHIKTKEDSFLISVGCVAVIIRYSQLLYALRDGVGKTEPG